MALKQVTLYGDDEKIETIEGFLLGRPEFKVLEGYRINTLVSIRTGVAKIESSYRLVFGHRAPSTLRIFMREPGEMCIRIEGAEGEVENLLQILPIPMLAPTL